MIYYRVLSRKTSSDGHLYYLNNNTDFKFKRQVRYIIDIPNNYEVYKDVYSSYPADGYLGLKEELFNVLNYIQVEEFFTKIQSFYIRIKDNPYCYIIL